LNTDIPKYPAMTSAISRTEVNDKRRPTLSFVNIDDDDVVATVT